MTALTKRKGLVLFLGIIALVILAALAAYQMTGAKGIEERFSHAVGLDHGEDAGEEGGGWFGFSIEGSPLLYAAVICGLGIGCYAAYRHFSV